MKNNKILVLGYFGYENNQLDGQTVKTRNVFEMLKMHCDNVSYFDTQTFQRNPFRVLLMFWLVVRCNTLIYLPAHNNLRVFFLPIYYLSKIFKFKINYLVIGGWLADFIKDKPRIAAKLKFINTIFPETKDLTQRLDSEYGMTNVVTYPNFRFNDNTLNKPLQHDGFKVLFFARIHNMKGYHTTFEVAQRLKTLGVCIDFYGPIYDGDKEDFLSLIASNSNTDYRGVIQPNDIFDTLNEYDVLIFPTRYRTEGFPGSVLDAYSAGVTVVASDWNYANEFIDDGECGFICEMYNAEQFADRIMQLYNDRGLLYKMRVAALKKAEQYSAEKGWEIIKEYL